ncbi:hypothetical protein GLOIN_2v1768822 [Rhizophagus irregularis DAOM 181602=DAOM 197198]|nr:hypothetical protein GLOIN_2v1768822 [Rhizophagus irregularis DAOM 181602=DAOM 197198]
MYNVNTKFLVKLLEKLEDFAYDNNNRSLIDYLKVKQHINNLRDSSFLAFLKVGLREYAADNISEKHIIDTIKLTADEDLAPYEALLSEY